MNDPQQPRPPAPPTQPTRPLGAPATTTPVAREAPVVERPVERLPPQPPADGPWWENPWPAVLTGILGLIVGGLVGYAVGGKGETVTEAQRNAGPAITHTVTQTTTVVHPKVVVRTNTVTQKTVTQAPPPANAEGEQRLSTAEASLRKAERENEELKRRVEEG
jgi:hypothetical protein